MCDVIMMFEASPLPETSSGQKLHFRPRGKSQLCTTGCRKSCKKKLRNKNTIQYIHGLKKKLNFIIIQNYDIIITSLKDGNLSFFRRLNLKK